MTYAFYRLYGLMIESDIPLGEPVMAARSSDFRLTSAPAMDPTTQMPDGELLAYLELPDKAHYAYVRLHSGDYIVRFFGICDFHVAADLRAAVACPVRDIPDGLIDVLAAGALLSFILIMSDIAVLHASAVQVGESVLAFVGYSGMGKSTMATLCCADGALLVTDDVLRVDIADDRPVCRLGARELRLRKAAAVLADRFERRPISRKTADLRDGLRATPSISDRLPLAAIVVPRPNRETSVTVVRRLDPIEALLSLVQYPRIVGWQDDVTQEQQFHHLGRISEQVPVFVADIPWGPPFPDDVARIVMAEAGLDSAP